MESREIRDLPEERGDDNIQLLLERYNIQEMHGKYLRECENLGENVVSGDRVYDDTINIQLLPGQLRHKATN